jgi:glycine/D-amino acid oxidase-like deaminating enzyme
VEGCKTAVSGLKSSRRNEGLGIRTVKTRKIYSALDAGGGRDVKVASLPNWDRFPAQASWGIPAERTTRVDQLGSPPKTSIMLQSNHRNAVASGGLRARGGDRSAVVIGGGIHGVTVATALADVGIHVNLVEKNEQLLSGTSAATHNRAHRGYHYPRSLRTARECMLGLRYFESRHPEALTSPRENYYAIEKASRVSTQAYEAFCRRLQLECTDRWPDRSLLSRRHLDGCYLVSEPCFNLRRLTQSLCEHLRERDVALFLGSSAMRSERRRGKHLVTVRRPDQEFVLESDLVINATYAETNAVLDRCRLSADRIAYEYHVTEVVVLRNPGEAIPAITIMDGPFMTLLPYAGHDDLLLLYDVMHSVHERRSEPFSGSPTPRTSNWPIMREHGRRYFPFIDSLEYVRSYWGVRPVSVPDRRSARDTKIIAHRSSPGFFSICEGKFVSAPLIADRLVRRLRKEQLL